MYRRRLSLKYRCSVDQLLLSIQTRMIKQIKKLLKIFSRAENFLFCLKFQFAFHEKKKRIIEREKKEKIKKHIKSKAIRNRHFSLEIINLTLAQGNLEISREKLANSCQSKIQFSREAKACKSL